MHVLGHMPLDELSPGCGQRNGWPPRGPRRGAYRPEPDVATLIYGPSKEARSTSGPVSYLWQMIPIGDRGDPAK